MKIKHERKVIEVKTEEYVLSDLLKKTNKDLIDTLTPDEGDRVYNHYIDLITKNKKGYEYNIGLSINLESSEAKTLKLVYKIKKEGEEYPGIERIVALWNLPSKYKEIFADKFVDLIKNTLKIAEEIVWERIEDYKDE